MAETKTNPNSAAAGDAAAKKKPRAPHKVRPMQEREVFSQLHINAWLLAKAAAMDAEADKQTDVDDPALKSYIAGQRAYFRHYAAACKDLAAQSLSLLPSAIKIG